MEVYLTHPGEHPEYHIYEILNLFEGRNVTTIPGSETVSVICKNDSGEVIKTTHIGRNDRKIMKRDLYLALSEATGCSSPWGAMTGIRPVKFFNDIARREGSPKDGYFNEDAALSEMKKFYLVRDDKAALTCETARSQRSFLEEQAVCPELADVYISVPFCPSRCLYCSFTSNSIVKYKKYVDPYLDRVDEELASVAEISKEKGYKISSVYLGGGTPTSFDDERFGRYMEIIRKNIDFTYVKEFALEAGRPDSLTPGKLDAAKEAGVTRLSINPQTMNDKTLRRIGRAHTAADVLKAFELAYSKGFENINTDIIAGLPGEDIDDFEHTLEEIGKLSPKGLTVHTLSVKRAADLRMDQETRAELRPELLEKMTREGYGFAKSMGMHPFYLYRQKNMLGNHENTGYCIPGYESPYNIHIMEEDRTVLAAGCGSVTKYVAGDKILRQFDVKSIEEYHERYKEMIEKKRELLALN